MAIHVVNEARRCLNCKVPQCRKGCPIQTPIPDMIQLFLQGKTEEAGQMLFENNPLSVVCSLVCDHDKQCEGHCILGRKGAPVHVSSIENYISDSYLDRLELKRAENQHKRVAIIGSGPAGITISVLLAQKGYDVTLFESRDKIGGVLRYGIPEFRLPGSILDRYADKLRQLGIKIRPNTSIGGALTVDDLQRDGYKAIFIGTGVWRPKKLGIAGESLGHVHFAIDYLVNPDVYQLGDHLAVIGAGNSAMDVARTAIRKGVRHVTVLSRSQTPSASAREVEYAVADGVEFLYGASPVELTDEGVIYQPMEPDEEGNMQPVGEPKLFPCSSIVISISQGPKNKIVSTTKGLETTSHGLLATDEKGNTTREGIFASGDVVLGARTVVEAVRYSKEVAQAMDEYLQTLE
ncbi:MAG: NAD(P)-dependent oxidoreductase [Candidatus Fournierella pullistercoris]|uniref:NAD(P)-dependent oxidoreductase n=1 Tax=Candidatus Allofournierella pullistercoris TaxID=2838597 RepID=A0A948T256_9FIRM|nr:NAD(P)-dependent oxidoreductase [Candidatus Fournierella pullistercoris]